MEEEEDEEQYEDANARSKLNANAHQPPSSRLQEYIRLANFHILQLARPECILNKRKLLSYYILFYSFTVRRHLFLQESTLCIHN